MQSAGPARGGAVICGSAIGVIGMLSEAAVASVSSVAAAGATASVLIGTACAPTFCVVLRTAVSALADGGPGRPCSMGCLGFGSSTKGPSRIIAPLRRGGMMAKIVATNTDKDLPQDIAEFEQAGRDQGKIHKR